MYLTTVYMQEVKWHMKYTIPTYLTTVYMQEVKWHMKYTIPTYLTVYMQEVKWHMKYTIPTYLTVYMQEVKWHMYTILSDSYLTVYAVGNILIPRSTANQLLLSSLVWQFRGVSSRERMSSSVP